MMPSYSDYSNFNNFQAGNIPPIPHKFLNDPHACNIWNSCEYFRNASDKIQSRILKLGPIWPENADQVAVHRNACLGHVDSLKQALQRDPSIVNLLDNRGNTPLNLAASAGEVNVALCLLQAGADPNSRDEYQCTPIMWAARYGRVGVMRVLVDYGADPNAFETHKCDALAYAAKYGQNQAIRFLLMEAKAKPKKDKYENSLLFNSILSGNFSTCKMLIDEFKFPIKGDVDKHGRNCLHFAIWKGMTPIVEDLLRNYSAARELILTPNTQNGETSYELAVKFLGRGRAEELFGAYITQEQIAKLNLNLDKTVKSKEEKSSTPDKFVDNTKLVGPLTSPGNQQTEYKKPQQEQVTCSNTVNSVGTSYSVSQRQPNCSRGYPLVQNSMSSQMGHGNSTVYTGTWANQPISNGYSYGSGVYTVPLQQLTYQPPQQSFVNLVYLPQQPYLNGVAYQQQAFQCVNLTSQANFQYVSVTPQPQQLCQANNGVPSISGNRYLTTGHPVYVGTGNQTPQMQVQPQVVMMPQWYPPAGCQPRQ